MKIVTALAATLLVVAPAGAGARGPAARLSVAQSTAQNPAQAPAQAPAGQGTGEGNPGRFKPVPGYKFIAGTILLGIGGVIFAITQQDGTPDSN